MQIESYRTRWEEFEQTLNRELYRAHSGRKEQPEWTAVYSDYFDLFSVESIGEVKSELENTDISFSGKWKSLRKIHTFLIDQHLDFRAASLTQEIDRFAMRQTVGWEGNTLAFSQIPIVLKNEPDATRRRLLSEKCADALSDAEGLVRDKLTMLRSTAAALGFKDYVRAKEYIAGTDYARLLDAAEASMERLEDLYLERLRVSVEATLGIPLQEAGSWDVGRWRLLNDPVHFFDRGNLLPVMDTTLSDLGIKPENPDAFSMDLEPRPLKRSRPCCIPIRIPQEIKIVMQAESGSGHYAALLHESGHASHFAWTSRSLPVEHRLWGDRALAESYAFLLEHLYLDPEWLARMLLFRKSRDFLRFQALYRVFLIRRWIGKGRFALKLYQSESPGDMGYLYADTMRAGTGFRYHPELWLADFADGLEAADYLRGWILECMLREYLSRRYGKMWRQNRSAGGFLKEIWETGQLYRAEEMGRELGFGNLDPQILADDLSKGLHD
jgi:hypothetical protein